MEEELLAKIRKLHSALQENKTGELTFDYICGMLGNIMPAAVYAVDSASEILSYNLPENVPQLFKLESNNGKKRIPSRCNEVLLSFDEEKINISSDDVKKFCKSNVKGGVVDGLYMIIPILSGGKRSGTLVFYRNDAGYDTADSILGEAGAAMIGMELQRNKRLEDEEKEKLRNVVQLSIGTLSYSEIDAVKRIFENLEHQEGLLVASKIADEAGITRSVIVNALRKLQSAGLIETRSLGMKGTHIKVLNPKFTEELDKLHI